MSEKTILVLFGGRSVEYEVSLASGQAVLSARWYPEEGPRTLTLRGRGRGEIRRLRPLEITKYQEEQSQ